MRAIGGGIVILLRRGRATPTLGSRECACLATAILSIYVLLVAQFGSFRLPLVILTPIPLTLIGIVLGHWLLGAAFTATSMIGFIARRHHRALVNFIRHSSGQGKALRAVVCRDDRGGHHPARSDLPGACDLAPVRPRLVDRC